MEVSAEDVKGIGPVLTVVSYTSEINISSEQETLPYFRRWRTLYFKILIFAICVIATWFSNVFFYMKQIILKAFIENLLWIQFRSNRC